MKCYHINCSRNRQQKSEHCRYCTIFHKAHSSKGKKVLHVHCFITAKNSCECFCAGQNQFYYYHAKAIMPKEYDRVPSIKEFKK